MITKRSTATALSTVALAFGAAACGGDESSTTATGAEQNQSQSESQRPEPVAKIDSLSGQSTSVKLDSGFVEALTALKVTPGVVGEGELTEGGSARFPITGGNVTYYEPGSVSPYVQGRIDHEGSGLSLTAGGKEVELTDFVVDPGASVLTGRVTVDGEEAAASAPLFFLDGRTLEPLKTIGSDRAVLEGTTVKLKAEAADLLNQTFGIQDLEEGLEIGVARIVVNTK